MVGVIAYLSKVLAVAPISFPISGTASGRTYPTPLGGVGHNADFLLGGQQAVHARAASGQRQRRRVRRPEGCRSMMPGSFAPCARSLPFPRVTCLRSTGVTMAMCWPNATQATGGCSWIRSPRNCTGTRTSAPQVQRAYTSSRTSRIGRSTLVMDSDYAMNERYFNHEMGHVFGLLHEHQRYDRDYYVRVRRKGSDYEKIPRLRVVRFLWFRWYEENTTTFSTPYDYHSIMHHPQNTGITLRSDNQGWIVNMHNNREWARVNGNTWFSPWDIYTIKKIYGISPNPRPNFTPRSTYP